MSLKRWEKKVLQAPGAKARVAAIQNELRLAAGLTDLREQAGLSQRELADRIGVSQPRIAAIERSRNVTLEVLAKYVDAVGGRLEVTVTKGRRKIPLGTGAASRRRPLRSSNVRKASVPTQEKVRARRRKA